MEESFINEQIRRFKMPWKHPAFISYFVWIIFLFGGLGIFVTIYIVSTNKNASCNMISESIATTFIALIAGSIVDLNLSTNIKNFASLNINSMGFVGLSVLLLFLSFNLTGGWSLIPAILGYICSLIIWILANADNEKLSDENYYKKMLEKAEKLANNWDK